MDSLQQILFTTDSLAKKAFHMNLIARVRFRAIDPPTRLLNLTIAPYIGSTTDLTPYLPFPFN